MNSALIAAFFLISVVPTDLTAQNEDPHLLGNAPITFYGKVVDENNQPVAGVQVRAEILVGYMVSPTQGGQRLDQISLTTDPDGKFTVDNVKGTSIRFNVIQKDGYQLSPRVGKPTYLYYPVKVHPNFEKPEIFRMWKMRGKEPLIQTGWDHKLSCDGTINRFDLLHGSQNAHGNLEIVCTRVPLNIVPRENRRFDYSIKITIVGGGIQPTDDEFTYLAPENGYRPDLTIAQKADNPKWQGGMKQEFYIKTKNGDYGRLFVDWYAWQTSPTHLDWNCSINPSGSRNLER
jgi:hypothetical protein